MNIWLEVFLALALLFAIGVVWSFLQQLFGLDKEEKKKDLNPKKGVDFIGLGVVFLCHDGKGNYVTYKRGAGARDEQGKWDIGAGSVEFGEKLEDALRREVKEEYQTDILEIEYMGFRDVHRTTPDGRPTHWVVFDYRCLVNRDMVTNGEPNTIDEVRWTKIEDLPTPRHSQLPFYLDKYKDRI